MQIQYCDGCNKRVNNDEARAIGGKIFCPACAAPRAPAKTPAKVPATVAPSSAARLPRPASSGNPTHQAKSNSNLPFVIIGVSAGILGLIVIIFALTGKEPAKDVAAGSAPASAPVNPIPPAIPAPENPTRTEAPKNETKAPEPAAKSGGSTVSTLLAPTDMDDPRERYATKAWSAIKADADRGAGGGSIRKRVRDFAGTYASTAAGKEAMEYLKRLTANDPPAPTTATIVAQYSRDFKPGTPGQGWRYLWNANADIGKTAQYAALPWNAKISQYAGDANNYPLDAVPGYICLHGSGGHPGRGANQGATYDRFAIAAYTLQPGQSGKMALNGTIHRFTLGNTIECKIFVNEAEKETMIVAGSNSSSELLTVLGELKEGDTVYTAIGPDKDDACDSFKLDFSIYKIP